MIDIVTDDVFGEIHKCLKQLPLEKGVYLDEL
jgi:hypothetical protein